MLKTSYSTLLKLFVAGFALAVLSIFTLDKTVYLFLHAALAEQKNLWETVTLMGSYKWMIGMTIIAVTAGFVLSFLRPAPILTKIWRSGLFILLSIAPVAVVAYVLKGTIGRARPYLYDTEGPFSFMPLTYQDMFAGFPSGHTTIAFAFATMVAILFPRLAIAAFVGAALTGFSRLALDAHYLADVIFGATFGTVCTIFMAKKLAAKFKY
ncbi:MAG: phosphatase PAP2 family protein [Rhodobacteraceae bacterium]|nr:phosphatase PAP2 family protein [Paracoccaceae bacterium]